MVTTILFDLSEVLLRGMLGVQDRLAAVLPYSPETIHRQYSDPEWARLLTGRMFEVEYWRVISRRYTWGLPVDFLTKAVRENFGEIEGTREVILKLRSAGYRLGLLSNHVREWVDELESRYPFHHLFDRVLFSCHIGMRKPERSAFIHALTSLRASPAETMFIDDDIKNITAARELGLFVTPFHSPLQLVADLRRQGITI